MRGTLAAASARNFAQVLGIGDNVGQRQLKASEDAAKWGELGAKLLGEIKDRVRAIGLGPVFGS